ncbi:hypothetical protein BDA96_05G033200 [Sorghum bicolor]|uniref:Hydrophobic seed protein domain-containing protein n=1 Tax=Sorghum bicolor TaxID=4558 RepID=A0A921UF26_SORBI|nr:hypothetical protein BDA96_05G033200 [Sorghum bicolor]
MAASNNKSGVSMPALLFVALMLTTAPASSVRAQQSPPPPPSQNNPCPSGYPNSIAFTQGAAAYLVRGILLLVLVPVGPVTPGNSLVNCFCYPTTNITIPVLPPLPPVTVPNINGPLACVQAPI